MERLNITIPEYHARPEISSGFIRTFESEGAFFAYHAYVKRDVEHPDTNEKRLGRIFHLAMEDAAAIEDRVLIMPETIPNDWGTPTADEKKAFPAGSDDTPLNFRCKRHREFRDEYVEQAQSDGKEIMLPGDKEILVGQVESVWENPACRDFLGAGPESHEVPCFSADFRTKLPTKALADILLDDAVVDFKTTRMTTSITFVRDARKKGYHWQADHYKRVTGRQRHVIITVTNSYPFESMVYELSPQMLASAHADNERAMFSIKHCYQLFGEDQPWHSSGWGAVQTLDYEGVVM